MAPRVGEETKIEFAFEVDGVPNELFLAMEPAASRKGHVWNRLANSVRHYQLAKKLDGIDNEMGFLRLVAAEEEVVVAIFELLKRDNELKDFCRSFAKKNKSHHFKTVMPIVIAQAVRGIFKPIKNHFLEEGMIADKDPVFYTMQCGGIGIAFERPDGGPMLCMDLSKLHLRELDDANISVHECWLEEARERIMESTGETIREFVVSRVERRNDVLYADDRSIRGVAGSVSDHIEQEFGGTLKLLYYALAIILTTKLSSEEHGVIRNIFRLYEDFMREAGFLK